MAVVSPVPERLVLVGRIAGVYGVRGWLRVESHTRPAENLLHYRHWRLQRPAERQASVMRLLEGRIHGQGLIVQLATADGEPLQDRDRAAGLVGSEVRVPRAELPPARPGEYYWADLIGLEVRHTDGRRLGQVTGLLETGAHDVLVVGGERERLIPFVSGPIVQEVDIPGGSIRVDWDPEY